MELKLHANARATPNTRAYIQACGTSVAELADELGVSETTIRRWKNRNSVLDRSREQLARARSAAKLAEQPVAQLSGQNEGGDRRIAIGTMHLAKGLEFKAVVVMACDEAAIPSAERLVEV